MAVYPGHLAIEIFPEGDFMNKILGQHHRVDYYFNDHRKLCCSIKFNQHEESVNWCCSCKRIIIGGFAKRKIYFFKRHMNVPLCYCCSDNTCNMFISSKGPGYDGTLKYTIRFRLFVIKEKHLALEDSTKIVVEEYRRIVHLLSL